MQKGGQECHALKHKILEVNIVGSLGGWFVQSGRREGITSVEAY